MSWSEIYMRTGLFTNFGWCCQLIQLRVLSCFSARISFNPLKFRSWWVTYYIMRRSLFWFIRDMWNIEFRESLIRLWECGNNWLNAVSWNESCIFLESLLPDVILNCKIHSLTMRFWMRWIFTHFCNFRRIESV